MTSCGPKKSEFQLWLEIHSSKEASSLEQKVALAKRLYDESSDAAAAGSAAGSTVKEIIEGLQSSPINIQNIASWNGISVDWFLDAFCEIPYVKRWKLFGCPLWFIRNVCITEILRRNGICSGPFIDHVHSIESTTSTMQRPNIVSNATIFLSYSGRQIFDNFTKLLQQLRGEYIWMDIFCVDQFAWTGQGRSAEMNLFRQQFLNKLKHLIGQIGRTALMLETMRGVMTTLGQIWVLWEVFNTFEVDASFSVLMPPTETKKFTESLESGSMGDAQSLLNSIDANYALADDPFDRVMILDLIKEQGISKVNFQVTSQIRLWLLEKARAYLSFRRQGEGGASQTCLRGVGNLLATEGNEAEAKVIFEEAINIGKAKRHFINDSNSNAETILAMISLGAFTAEPKDQETHFRESLSLSRECFGEDHGMTVRCKGKLAVSLTSVGQLSEAEPLLKEVLCVQRKHLGDKSEETIASILNMGVLLDQQGKSLEADAFFEEALTNSQQHLGSHHPVTLKCKTLRLRRQGSARNSPATGHTESSRPGLMLGEVLSETEERLGMEHAQTLETKIQFASLLAEKGEFQKADAIFRSIVAKCIDELGNTHPLTVTAKSLFSMALAKMGKLKEAEALSREVLEIRKQLLGNDDSKTLEAMNNLGCLLAEQVLPRQGPSVVHNTFVHARDKTGKLDEVESLFRQVVTGRRKLLGNQHLQTLRAMDNLAGVLQKRGKFCEAEELFKEVLAGFDSCLGQDHPHTKGCRENLNFTRSFTDRTAPSSNGVTNWRRWFCFCPRHKKRCNTTSSSIEKLKLEQLFGLQGAIWMEIGDPRRVQAEEQERKGDFAAAEECYRAILRDKPEDFDAMHRVAYNLFRQGKNDESEDLHRKAFNKTLEARGGEHSETLGSMVWLANQLSERENTVWEAVKYFREALKGMRKQKNTHARFLECSYNLGVLLSSKKETMDEAEELFREALRIADEQGIRNQNNFALRSAHNLAVLLKNKKKSAEAVSLFRASGVGTRELLGNDHPSSLRSKFMLASCLVDEGNFYGAEPLLREALAGFRRQLGKEDGLTLSVMDHLHISLMHQQKFVEAEAIAAESLKVKQKLHGRYGRDSLAMALNLAQACACQGKLKVAEMLYSETWVGLKRLKMQNDAEALVTTCVEKLPEVLRARKRFNAEEVFLRDALVHCIENFGDNHRVTLMCRSNLATRCVNNSNKVSEGDV